VVGRQDDLEAPDPSCHSPRIMNDSRSIDSIAYQTNRISLPGPRNRSDLRVALTRRGRGKYLKRVGGSEDRVPLDLDRTHAVRTGEIPS